MFSYNLKNSLRFMLGLGLCFCSLNAMDRKSLKETKADHHSAEALRKQARVEAEKARIKLQVKAAVENLITRIKISGVELDSLTLDSLDSWVNNLDVSALDRITRKFDEYLIAWTIFQTVRSEKNMLLVLTSLQELISIICTFEIPVCVLDTAMLRATLPILTFALSKIEPSTEKTEKIEQINKTTIDYCEEQSPSQAHNLDELSGLFNNLSTAK